MLINQSINQSINHLFESGKSP